MECGDLTVLVVEDELIGRAIQRALRRVLVGSTVVAVTGVGAAFEEFRKITTPRVLIVSDQDVHGSAVGERGNAWLDFVAKLEIGVPAILMTAGEHVLPPELEGRRTVFILKTATDVMWLAAATKLLGEER